MILDWKIIKIFKGYFIFCLHVYSNDLIFCNGAVMMLFSLCVNYVYCWIEKMLDGRVNPKSEPRLKEHNGAININVAKNSLVFQTKTFLQLYFTSPRSAHKHRDHRLPLSNVWLPSHGGKTHDRPSHDKGVTCVLITLHLYTNMVSNGS